MRGLKVHSAMVAASASAWIGYTQQQHHKAAESHDRCTAGLLLPLLCHGICQLPLLLDSLLQAAQLVGTTAAVDALKNPYCCMHHTLALSSGQLLPLCTSSSGPLPQSS